MEKNLGDKSNSEMECSVCLHLFQQPVKLLPCKHTFCVECISQWLAVKRDYPSCPKCRSVPRSACVDRECENEISKCLENFPRKRFEKSERFERTAFDTVNSLEDRFGTHHDVMNSLKNHDEVEIGVFEAHRSSVW